jgi:hypothetical protein
VIKAGKIVYTAKTRTTGERESGASRSSDGLMDIRLSTRGSAGIGTNPEQLFELVGLFRKRDRACGSPEKNRAPGCGSH